MVSGQNDRINVPNEVGDTSRVGPSMVSGQNDRINLVHVDGGAVRVINPQWCPAKMTGLMTRTRCVTSPT